MQSVHSHTLRRFASALLLAVCALSAGAVNRLHSPRASMEAPPGMTYDSALSSAMGMDVFRSHARELIIAIGEQRATEGVSAESLAKAFTRGGRRGYTSISVAGHNTAYAGTGSDGRTVFATACHPADGNITVILIVGDMTQADAEHFIATLAFHQPA